MSLADALVGILFKTDAGGRRLFFPNGVLGRGYVVPDAATEQRLRGWMLKAQIIAIGGAVAAMLVLHALVGTMQDWSVEIWIGFCVAVVALTLAMRLVMNRLASGLQPAPKDARLGLGEAYARQAVALPRWYHWTQVISSGLLAGCSLAVMVLDSEQRLLGLGCFALFGAITAYSVYGLRAQAVRS